MKKLFQKMKKTTRILSIMTAACLLTGAFSVAAAPKAPSSVAYVGTDGLYYLNLKTNASEKFDNSDKIRHPILSPNGLYIAYCKEDNLFICDIKKKTPVMISEKVNSFAWDSNNNLIFSPDYHAGYGLYSYYPSTKQQKTIKADSYAYSDICCDGLGNAYVTRNTIQHINGATYCYNNGVYCINVKTGYEKLIVAGISAASEQSIGFNPSVAKISQDSQYVYIWERPSSSSFSADGGSLGVYDAVNNDYQGDPNYRDKNNLDKPLAQIILQYQDNLSISPTEPGLIAMNIGSGREMIYTKKAGVAHILDKSFLPFTDDDIVTMTPSFSLDGKTVYFSAAKDMTQAIEENPAFGDDMLLWDAWNALPHRIYGADVKTGRLTQITNTTNFDFLPMELSDGDLLFVRVENGSYHLYRKNQEGETCLAEDLNFTGEYVDSGFYGHHKSEEILDLYLSQS